jgi:hypothetical protein
VRIQMPPSMASWRSRIQVLIKWSPLALTAAGFGYLLIVLSFLGPPGYWFLPAWPPIVLVPLLTFWAAAYLFALFGLRRSTSNSRGDTKSLVGTRGRWLTVASAAPLAAAFILTDLLVHFPLRVKPCNGPTVCFFPTYLPFTFGLFTPFQVLMLVFALISTGILLLAVAVWRRGTLPSHSRPYQSGRSNRPSQ